MALIACSNLTIACKPCNDAKGTRTAEEFGFPHIQAQARAPLRDAAAVNATRWALYHRLVQPWACQWRQGPAGRTKWNRTTRELPKTHWTDAACVGASTPKMLKTAGVVPLQITAMGRHARQMCRTDAQGFPNKAAKATSVVGGLPHRRSRASRRPSEQRKGRRLRGPTGGAGDGVVQHHDS